MQRHRDGVARARRRRQVDPAAQRSERCRERMPEAQAVAPAPGRPPAQPGQRAHHGAQYGRSLVAQRIAARQPGRRFVGQARRDQPCRRGHPVLEVGHQSCQACAVEFRPQPGQQPVPQPRCLRVGAGAAVPRGQKVQCVVEGRARRAAPSLQQVQQAGKQVACLEVQVVVQHLLHVRSPPDAAAHQQFVDAPGAEAGVPQQRERRNAGFGPDRIVRADDQPARRVDHLRQFVEVSEAAPVQRGGRMFEPAHPAWQPTRRLQRDVAAARREQDVQRQTLQAAQRRPEAGPVACQRHGHQRCDVAARQQPAPGERQLHATQ